MMREMGAAKQFAEPEGQQYTFVRRQHPEIRPVLPERDAVDVLMKQDADAMLDERARHERDPQRQSQQQREEGDGERDQRRVGQQRRMAARQQAARHSASIRPRRSSRDGDAITLTWIQLRSTR